MYRCNIIRGRFRGRLLSPSHKCVSASHRKFFLSQSRKLLVISLKIRVNRPILKLNVKNIILSVFGFGFFTIVHFFFLVPKLCVYN